MKKWGYLRETERVAARLRKCYGGNYTGLDVYLDTIFPKTHDWVNNKSMLGIRGSKSKIRPDYRSESLNLIIEFDGIRHYTKPYQILRDIKNEKIYRSLGYRIVRIPFFIQLTQKAIKTLFNVDVKEKMFDEKVHSLDVESECTPAFLCGAGIKRMKKDFEKFPEQLRINLNYLKKQPKDNQLLIEWEYLV